MGYGWVEFEVIILEFREVEGIEGRVEIGVYGVG